MKEEEKNKVIAAFDGWVDKSPFVNSDNEEFPWWVRGKQHHHYDLWYHKKWDWLMPVVEKIESSGRYGFEIDVHGVSILDYKEDGDNLLIQVDRYPDNGDTKMYMIHEAVFQFVQYYNTLSPEVQEMIKKENS